MSMHLSVEKISKSYRGGVVALDETTFSLGPGVAGLLGPNGAGKSTLMRILATSLPPTSGMVLWNGENIVESPQAFRQVLGYLPQSFGTYPQLTAVEFLRYIASAKRVYGKLASARTEELLNALNLWEVRNRPLGELSGGMRQRVGVAQALLNDPKVLILDEPTVGLDPEERVHLRNLISDLSAKKIVLYSTHVVSDLEAVASQIMLLREGRLCRAVPPQALLDELVGKVWEGTLANEQVESIRTRCIISTLIRTTSESTLRVISSDCPWPGAKATAPSLEDAYLSAGGSWQHSP